MNSYPDELYAHQEWADAEHWRAFEAHAAALEDQAIRERLLHIHLAQHGFLSVASPQRSDFAFKKLEDFPSMVYLKQYARQGLDDINALLKKTDDERMEEVIEVHPCPVPMADARCDHRRDGTGPAVAGDIPAQKSCTGRWLNRELNGEGTYSETLCSSFCERKTRSTE
jgi:hypothetical protein